MNRRSLFGKVFCLALILPALIFLFSNFSKPTPSLKTATLRLIFKNTVHGIPLILDTANYKNMFGEAFTVTKFKYYVSNISVESKTSKQLESESYHLIDARDSNSFSFSFPVQSGRYHDLFFLLGVDSIRNCSGAQTGALDPMNDMFWTWNSGYVMAKLEGGSPASKTMARMEYHIGGYKSNDNVVKRVDLHQSTPFVINDGKETVIVIETDLAKWWGEADKISIADNPLCTTPGSLAQRIAANYVSMFSIQNISNK